jgi:hypothetical protein
MAFMAVDDGIAIGDTHKLNFSPYLLPTTLSLLVSFRFSGFVP